MGLWVADKYNVLETPPIQLRLGRAHCPDWRMNVISTKDLIIIKLCGSSSTTHEGLSRDTKIIAQVAVSPPFSTKNTTVINREAARPSKPLLSFRL